MALAGCAFAASPQQQVETIWDFEGDNVEWIVTSPDGSSFAAAVRSGASVTVYKDKTAVGTHKTVANPIYSPKSGAFAYLAIDDDKASIVADGNIYPLNMLPDPNIPELLPFAMAPAMRFSFDGKLFAFRDSAGPPSPLTGSHVFDVPLQAIFINGKSDGNHLEVGWPSFNPTKAELAYRVQDTGPGTQSYVTKAGSAGKKYIGILDPVVFSADGIHLAYVARLNTNHFVSVLDGKEQGAGYDFISGITFSPDGKRLAFVAGQPGGGSQSVVIDGNADSPFPFVDPVVFSPDSSKYGYIANTNLSVGAPGTNDTIVIVNGQQVARISGSRAIGPFFGAQGHLAYVVQSGARGYIVVDGNRKGPYAFVGYPGYSTDGQHLAYLIVDGISSKSKIVVDGVLSDPYIVATAPQFRSATKLDFLAVQQTDASKFRLVRVTETF